MSRGGATNVTVLRHVPFPKCVQATIPWYEPHTQTTTFAAESDINFFEDIKYSQSSQLSRFEYTHLT